MTCSIFIKSCPKDFGFLAYCLKSIHKLASGFDEVVVVIPDNSDLPLTKERIVKLKEPTGGDETMHGKGYVWQQVVKMNADKYCKSDFICHMDSDSIFVEPVNAFDGSSGLSPFFIYGKPIWLMTPMVEVVAGDKNSHAHATSMREFSGIDPEFEYMRRIGQVIPRWAYGCFRDYVQELHHTSFEMWAMNRGFRGVTEFNFIGQYLHREFSNFIHFHDTRFGLPRSVVRQFWSWNGLTEEIRTEIENALA